MGIQDGEHVYTHGGFMFPILNLLHPPSLYHPSGSSECTRPKCPVSFIEPGLVIHFTYDNIHVSVPFSLIIPPSPSPTESKRMFYTSVSLYINFYWSSVVFPSGSEVKASACICLQCRRAGFNPWVEKITWRRKWQPTPVLLPGKSHGWRSLVQATFHGVAKSRAWLSDFTFPGGSDGEEPACNVGELGSIPGLGGSHEEGNGYPCHCSCHCSIPAWRIPWTEEPGRLESIGLQRVRRLKRLSMHTHVLKPAKIFDSVTSEKRS